jgi:hypothetical protein
MPSLLDHAKAAITNDEPSRLARRREIRRKIAERTEAEKRAEGIRQRIVEIDREADQAADLHQRECQPLQTEIQTLTQQIIEAAADRQPAPEDAETRRRQLLADVDAQNEILAELVAACDRRRKPLQEELRQILKRVTDGAALEYRLSHEGTGHPDLLLQKFVLQRALEYATARLGGAVRKVETHEAEIASIKAGRYADIAPVELWLARWRAERAAAQAEVERLGREANDLHERIVNE